MAVITDLKNASTTAASNPPDGDVETVDGGDDHLRSVYALLKSALSVGSDVTAASTITPPANFGSAGLSGTTGVTAMASTNSWAGRVFMWIHKAAHTFTSSSTLLLPNGANVTFASGDKSWWIDRDGAGTWECVAIMTATLLAKFGNASFSSSTVPVNGIYLPSANTLGFAANTTAVGSLSTTVLTMPTLAVTGSTVPANGAYLSAANTLALASNTTLRASVNSTGNWTLAAPSSGVALSMTGVTGSNVISTTDGTASFGVFLNAANGVTLNTSSNHQMDLRTNNTTRLSIDSTGRVMKSTAQPAFRANNVTVGLTATGTVTSYSEDFDQGNNFSAGIFTAPVAGAYYFTYTVRVAVGSTLAGLIAQLNAAGAAVNGSDTCISAPASSNPITATWSGVVICSASDQVKVVGTTLTGTGANWNCMSFSGYLLG